MINWIYNPNEYQKNEQCGVYIFIYHLKEGGKKLEEKS